MRFPLAEWIDRHGTVPHNLGISGMRGMLRSTLAALRRPPKSSPENLRKRLGRIVGVSADRIVLTHGATESGALVLSFLRHSQRRQPKAAPRVQIVPPDYPVFSDAASALGYRVGSQGPAPIQLLSRPNNPTGLALTEERLFHLAEDGKSLLVDETFREFTSLPSVARHDIENVWVVGTFTKTYGADHIRVGYAVAPSEQVGEFERLHSVLADGLASSSVDQAVALLRHRSDILDETRAIFRRNAAYLAERIGEPPRLSAPLWFDRGLRGLDGDHLAHVALRRGILVCPGSFFGEPLGVRVCLTRRAFPRDLDAYLTVREPFVVRS